MLCPRLKHWIGELSIACAEDYVRDENRCQVPVLKLSFIDLVSTRKIVSRECSFVEATASSKFMLTDLEKWYCYRASDSFHPLFSIPIP